MGEDAAPERRERRSSHSAKRALAKELKPKRMGVMEFLFGGTPQNKSSGGSKVTSRSYLFGSKSKKQTR